LQLADDKLLECLLTACTSGRQQFGRFIGG
jgi:hypothetical protein